MKSSNGKIKSKIFYNQADKLRTGWRVIIFWGFALIPIFAWQILFRSAAALLSTTPRSLLPVNSDRAIIVSSILLCISSLFASYFSISKIEKSKITEFLGWRFQWNRIKLFFHFFGLSGVIMLVLFLVIIIFNIATVSIKSPDFTVFIPLLLFNLIIFLIASLAEETLDRGYIFQIVSQKSALVAILFTSFTFSITHLSEQWATSFALVNIFLVGCLLGFIYLKTKSLWAIWGFHFGLNVFEALVFQFPVKGYERLAGHIFSYKFNVPVLISGGTAGITGSILYTIVIAIMFFTLRKLYFNENQV